MKTSDFYYDLPQEEEPDLDPAALWWSEAPPLRRGGGTSDASGF